MAPKSIPRRFLATMYKIWMMRHVTVPEDISNTLANELVTRGKGATNAKPKINQSAKLARPTTPKYIPVVAIVNGCTSCTTLVPAGDGCHCMQINTTLYKAADADVGDVVSVELRLDFEARRAFEALPTGHRRQFINWFDSAKAPETRIRRLGRAMDVLLERAILGPSSRRAKSKSASH